MSGYDDDGGPQYAYRGIVFVLAFWVAVLLVVVWVLS